MPKNYRSTSEIYAEILETLVIELVPHAYGLDSGLLETLKDTKPGIYVPGSIEPLFEDNTVYQLVDQKLTYLGFSYGYLDIVKNIQGQLSIPPGNFYNETTGSVIKRTIYERIKHRLDHMPSLPAKGCDVAIGIAIEHLNSLCPYSSASHRQYNIENLVKPEFYHLLSTDQFEVPFAELKKDVARFVGRDDWNLYYHKVKGTVLIIEKGLDYRAAEWHRQQIEQSEAYDHDLGGLHEGYDIDGSHHSTNAKTRRPKRERKSAKR